MMTNPNNPAAEFLRYATSIQNPQQLLTNPAFTNLRQKYNAANPQQLAQERAQAMGISPQQLSQIAKQLGITQ